MIPDRWSEIRLGDLIEEYRVKSTVQDQHEVFTSSRNGLMPQSEYYGDGRIALRDNIGFHVIPPLYMTYRSRSDDGNFYINKNDLGRFGVISHFYPVFRFKDNDNQFFLDFLNFNRSKLGKHCVGSSQKVLSLNALKNITFSLPPHSERIKIAEILSTWDRAIEAVEALISNARAQKKALMQSLLTAKKRLPGFKEDWTQTNLGELGKFQKGKGISRAEVRATGLPCVRYGEIYTHHDDIIRTFNSHIAAQSASESQRIQQGDIMFTCSGETAEEIGKCVAYLGDHEAYAGGDIVIFSPTRDSSIFLAYLLNSSPLAAQKSKMGQGNSVVHISVSNLAKLYFSIPPRAEQEKIGNLLIEADNGIHKLEAQATALRQEKAALMQQLLTGKRRVKVNEREDA